MRLVKLPSQISYWETFITYSGVSFVMERNRFEALFRNIHFVNNLDVNHEGKSDHLWKLRPWVNSLRENFLKVSPEEYHAVDEIMVSFKRKSLLQQYMPKKPHKWGFELWGRSGISDLLYDCDIYQGKANKATTADKTSDLGISSSVDVDLCLALLNGHNFKVFAENFFTSFPLIIELKRRNIFYVGTIRLPTMKNCPLSAEKDLKKKGRGAFDYRLDVDSNIIAVRWFDNKSVNLVSSFAGVEPTHSVTRYD